MTHLRNVGRPLAVLALFGLLAVAHTWPLADVPTRRLPAHPDVLSGMWSLTALSRQMIENPAHLMDGNIFHPFSNTVAIVDHQFANALMAAPLVAAGVDAV